MIWVYLDAENVSEAEAVETISEIRKEAGSEIVAGKFYGAREQLGSAWEKYMDLGYEWVDTTDVSASKKNSTDIKICVDAFSDIFVHNSNVSKLFVISKDTDFLPLVRKVKRLGITVEVPLFKKSKAKTTLQDVTSGLREAGWKPMDEGVAILDNQFDRIRSLLGSEYSDELIEIYLQKKYLKFVYSILPANEDIRSLLDNLHGRTFSFWKLKKYNFSKKEMRVFISLYTSKCFGFTFSKEMLPKIVAEVFA